MSVYRQMQYTWTLIESGAKESVSFLMLFTASSQSRNHEQHCLNNFCYTVVSLRSIYGTIYLVNTCSFNITEFPSFSVLLKPWLWRVPPGGIQEAGKHHPGLALHHDAGSPLLQVYLMEVREGFHPGFCAGQASSWQLPELLPVGALPPRLSPAAVLAKSMRCPKSLGVLL